MGSTIPKKNIDVVSEKIFRNIFNKDFNISFYVPMKDKCAKCLRIIGQNEKENPEIINHLKEKRHKYNIIISKKSNVMLCTSLIYKRY